MNDDPAHAELVRAQAERTALDAKIAELEAERSRLDAKVASLAKAVNRTDLACWSCQEPESVDVKHWLLCNFDPHAAMSIGGLPRGCCRIGVFKQRVSVVRHA
jgi:hypothetical protein